MKSESACPTCPLNLMCTMGEALIVNKRNISVEAELALREEAAESAAQVGDASSALTSMFSPLGSLHIHGKPTVTPNVNKVRVCKGCYCVYFEHELHTYVCGVIRTGARHGGRVVKDHVQIALTGNGSGAHTGVWTRDISWTKGCSKRRKDKLLPNAPPTSSVVMDRGMYSYDCFAHLKSHFHEVRG